MCGEPWRISSDSSQTLKGATLVLRYLAHAGSAHGVLLYGNSPSQAAQVDFFLDLFPLLSKKDTREKYAAELNEHLAPRTGGRTSPWLTSPSTKRSSVSHLAHRIANLFCSIFKDGPSAGVMLAIVVPFSLDARFFPSAFLSVDVIWTELTSNLVLLLSLLFFSFRQSSLVRFQEKWRRWQVPPPVPLVRSGGASACLCALP